MNKSGVTDFLFVAGMALFGLAAHAADHEAPKTPAAVAASATKDHVAVPAPVPAAAAKNAASTPAPAAKETAATKTAMKETAPVSTKESLDPKEQAAQVDAPAAKKRTPIKINHAKEASRNQEYERARDYARGVVRAPANKDAQSKQTEAQMVAQLRAIIAAQQEEIEYLKGIARDLNTIKRSVLLSGYTYP